MRSVLPSWVDKFFLLLRSHVEQKEAGNEKDVRKTLALVSGVSYQTICRMVRDGTDNLKRLPDIGNILSLLPHISSREESIEILSEISPGVRECYQMDFNQPNSVSLPKPSSEILFDKEFFTAACFLSRKNGASETELNEIFSDKTKFIIEKMYHEDLLDKVENRYYCKNLVINDVKSLLSLSKLSLEHLELNQKYLNICENIWEKFHLFARFEGLNEEGILETLKVLRSTSSLLDAIWTDKKYRGNFPYTISLTTSPVWPFNKGMNQ